MKKIQRSFIYLLMFAALIGVGFLISTAQNNSAQVELATNGLSENARKIDQKKNQKIATFLAYLQKNYSQEKVQVQLQNTKIPNQYLIWSNYQIQKLPVDNGRSFALNDFNGEISFAIVGQKSVVQIYETQNNRYIKVGDDYLTVIGTLKQSFYRDNYYITTGTKQATAQNNLQDYELLIDGLSSNQYKNISKHLDGKVTRISDLEKVVTQYKSPIWVFIVAILLIILLLIIGPILSILDKAETRKSGVSLELQKRIKLNNFFKFLLTIILIFAVAMVVTYIAFYFNNFYQLLLVSGLVVVLDVISYLFFMMLPERKTN